MNSWINKLATPLTVALFVISAVSGLGLFFHVGESLFHEMHEWLSTLWLIPVVLHIVRNWRALMNYLQRGALWLPLVLALVAAGVFAWPKSGGPGGGGHGDRPPFALVSALGQASVTRLAPALQTTPEVLQQRLQQAGYTVTAADESIAQIASAAGVSSNKVLTALVPAKAED